MKFLIVDDLHPCIFDDLKKAGVEWDYKPEIEAAEVKKILPAYQGLIVRSKVYVDDALLGVSALKVIARAGAGVDNIDESVLEKRCIALINAPEGNCDAVAEHAIGMILSLLNNFRKSKQELLTHQWIREGNRGYELSNLTVGVIGYGYMGKAVCKRLVAFGCKVVVYDKQHLPSVHEGVEMVSLEELKKRTDILTVHIPLIDGNAHWIDKAFLDGFAKNIWVINTSRGKVVVGKDLPTLLASGKLRGLALDVWENERPETFSKEEKELFDKLLSYPQVIMTPHVAGWTFESYKKISEVMGRKILQWVNKS
ncbi:MAG: ldhA [Cytophagaceae bacterium]|jgi:D-3-phosphoglycerate dehydrogenase|nr:ldhA [Cytophagaceae bacterium]